MVILVSLWIILTGLGVALLHRFAPRRPFKFCVNAPVAECATALSRLCAERPLGSVEQEWIVGRVGHAFSGSVTFRLGLWSRVTKRSLVDCDGSIRADGSRSLIVGACRIRPATLLLGSAVVSLFVAAAFAILLRGAAAHDWQIAAQACFPAFIALFGMVIIRDKLSFAGGDAHALSSAVAGALSPDSHA